MITKAESLANAIENAGAVINNALDTANDALAVLPECDDINEAGIINKEARDAADLAMQYACSVPVNSNLIARASEVEGIAQRCADIYGDMVKVSNTPLLVRAADAAILGDDVSSGALAMGILGAMQSAKAELVAVIGDDRFPFVASEYLKKPIKADGKADAKLHSARSAAMMVDLYGQTADKIDSAVQSLRDKTFAAGVLAYHDELNLQLVKVTGRSGRVRHCVGGVPATLAFQLFDMKGKATAAYDKAAGVIKAALTVTNGGKAPSDDEVQYAVISFPVTCDGAENSMFGLKAPTTSQLCGILKEEAIRRGLADAVEGRSPRNGGDKGDKLLEHAKAIKVALAAFNEANGESDVTPSNDFEKTMDEVAEAWAAFRIAHPLI